MKSAGNVQLCPGRHHDIVQSETQDDESLVGEIQPGFLYPAKEVTTVPRKPKQPCAYPGCPRLTDGRYCEEHRKLVEKNYERYSRDPDVHKKYGARWRRIRAAYVKTHPFCEACFKRGILVPVDEVHHIVPVSRGGTHDPSNLMSLCRSCHNKIHHEMGDR